MEYKNMSSGPVETSLERGAAVIRRYVEMLPDAPGVYRMLNDKGEVTVEGEFVGRIEGFRFRQDGSATPDEAKTLKQQINSLWIYPPVADRAIALAAADPAMPVA